MKIKIKKLNENAVIPKYAKDGDAGMDLVATSKVYDEYGNISYGIGLAFEIPTGYVGLLFPRSSNAKKDLILSNSVGVLDSGYRGEISFRFKPSPIIADNTYSKKGTIGTNSDKFDKIMLPHGYNNDDYEYGFEEYSVGDRIGQIIIIPIPSVEFELTEELNDSERGEDGYGSSGK